MALHIKNKDMKILLLGLNGRGGTLQYASSVSSGLSECCNVALFIPSYSDTSLISKRVKRIRITAPPNAIKTAFHTFNIPMHIKAIKALNNEKADLINILDIHPWYMLYWPFLKGNKFVTINDPEPHSGEAGWMMMLLIKKVTRFLLKNADKIIVLGKKQAETIRRAGYKQEIILSRIGSYDFFTKRNNKKYRTEPLTMLFFGRIKEYKGLNYLLDAASILKDNGMHFKIIIAGEGDMTPYKTRLDKLGENIEILNGYVSDDKVNECFQRCSFVVMPYTDATQTGVVQVAYSFKKPVIATRVGSLPEVVINDKTGLLIRPKNTDELLEAMLKMLKNPAETKKKGLEGYRFMKKELDWDKITKRLWKELIKYNI